MTCEVVVLYFAKSAELAGVRTETISVPHQITSLQLWGEIVKKHSRDTMNGVGYELKDFIKLSEEKLSADEISALVISPCCGAVSLFIGTTRNNFDGRKVKQLEYEAYEPMAEVEMKKICTKIRLKWPSVRHIAIHHRLGTVPISEASVIVAISSPHRAESLEAVQYCINTLKATVPIWKKEVYEEEYSWKENKECFWADTVK